MHNQKGQTNSIQCGLTLNLIYIFRTGIKVISFIFILSILVDISNEWVSEPTYTRLTMNEMYNTHTNYTMGFLGASHVYQSFNPCVFDNMIDNCNSINLGSSGQSLTGTYYLLREFLKNSTPNVIILEITYPLYEDVYERVSAPEYALFDYMKPSFNKLQYFFAAFPPSDYANALFPIYRDRSKLKISSISQIYSLKAENGYNEYKPFSHADGWQYKTKGFVAVDWSYENMGFDAALPYQWDQDLIIQNNIEYLKKITNLCKSENIDIIWVTAPIPVYSIIEMDNYADVHNYFDALAKKCNTEYYDFNYCYREILERNDNLYFYDSSHMNKTYADIFSTVVCELLNERTIGMLEYNNYFYQTYDEMIAECQDGSLYNLTRSK